MDALFQLNVLRKVLQAVCGRLSALIVYTHMLHLERWCVCVCVLTGNDATGWRCHVLYQILVRYGVFFFFHSMFSWHFIFLFPDSLSDHPHLPPSQQFCPHKFRERIYGFSSVQVEQSLQLCDPLGLLPTVLTVFYLPPASICLARSPLHLAAEPSPHFKKCCF